jgi:hypothetical protein
LLRSSQAEKRGKIEIFQKTIIENDGNFNTEMNKVHAELTKSSAEKDDLKIEIRRLEGIISGFTVPSPKGIEVVLVTKTEFLEQRQAEKEKENAQLKIDLVEIQSKLQTCERRRDHFESLLIAANAEISRIALLLKTEHDRGLQCDQVRLKCESEL